MKTFFALLASISISLAIEQPPPHWSVVDINGQCFDQSNCLGQVVILVFANSPCVPADSFMEQALKPLASAHPEVMTLILFPELPESSVRGWGYIHRPVPTNICLVALPPETFLAAMFLEPGTNIWPTTWMLDKKGVACAKWRSFTQRPVMEPVICSELSPVRIKYSAGFSVLSWKSQPIQPVVQWKPMRATTWDSFSHPWPFQVNSAGYCQFPVLNQGFYRLVWE